MALDEMGVNYEHYKVVEFDKYAVQSYNAVHGTCFEPSDIRDIRGNDLEILYTDLFTYLLTYSFPCTDLSVAGKMQGMSKGSGTRSGLLWEVERLLTEIHDDGGELPQILFMENVPQVLSSANIKDFHAWQDFLTSLGYTNHVQILNAKDYGVAQNRERAFMFSFLGEYNYKFPEPIPLAKTMKDYLEDEVDEKYYINSEKADKLIAQLIDNKTIHFENGNNPCKFDKPYVDGKFTSMNGDISFRDIGTETAGTITSRYYKGIGSNGDNAVIVKQVGNIAGEKNFENPQTGRAYSTDGCAPTLNTCSGGGHEQKIIELGRLNSSQDGIVVDSSGISKTLTAGNNNQPKILDVKCLNTKDENGKQPPQHERVYDTSGIMTSILAEQGGRFNILEEKQIVAMRGRNPDNPSDRTAGAPTEQRLEPNVQGLCNAITSVQKDNLVLESAILTPKRTDYGKEIRKSYESGVVKESRHNMTQLEPRTDGISNTLTTVQKDNLVLETIKIDHIGIGHHPFSKKQEFNGYGDIAPCLIATDYKAPKTCMEKESTVRIKQATKDGYIDCKIGGVADLSFPTSKTRRGRVQDNGDTCPTITATETGICRIESLYRIRKLTPRECGRLMYVSDSNITKMLAVVSNSQAYKQFGNSIVVLVMIAMFSNLNIQGLPNWDGIKHKYFNPPYRA